MQSSALRHDPPVELSEQRNVGPASGDPEQQFSTHSSGSPHASRNARQSRRGGQTPAAQHRTPVWAIARARRSKALGSMGAPPPGYRHQWMAG